MKTKLITLALGAVAALSGFGATPIEYLDEKGATQTCTDYTVVESGAITVLDNGWYAVTNKNVFSFSCHVTGDARLILADGARLRCIGDDAPGVEIPAGKSLTVYGQRNCTGALEAEGSYSYAPGIGPEHGQAGGSLTVCGGRVMATAIGGASSGPGIGCALAVKGGVVTAIAEGKGAGVSEKLEVSGGTLRAEGGRTGGMDVATTNVTVTGGSVFARTVAGTPKNAAGTKLVRLTLMGLPTDDSSPLKEVVASSPYGARDIFPLDGKAYLWLPEGDCRVAVVTPNGNEPLYYLAELKSLPADAYPFLTLGFTVDGVDVLGAGHGAGWDYTFTNGILRLTAAGKTYRLSGNADGGEVRVETTTGATKPTVILSSAVICTKDLSAISGCIVKPAEGEFMKVGTGPDFARYVESAEGDELQFLSYFRAAKKVKMTVPEITPAEIALPATVNAVSNRLEAIGAVKETYGTDYWVMKGDDICVSYTPRSGFLRVGDNPVVFRSVQEDFTLTADKLPVGKITPLVNDGHYIVSHGTEWLDLRAVTNGIRELRVVCVSDPTLTLGGASDWGHVLSDVSTRIRWIDIYDGLNVKCSLWPFEAVYRVGDEIKGAVYGLCDPSEEPVRIFLNGGEGAFELGAIPKVPYRSWENGAISNRNCQSYFPLSTGTNTLEDNRWYVVNETLSCCQIEVQGRANLILTDQARLTVTSGIVGGTLALYAETAFCEGTLKVSKDVTAALEMHGGQVTTDAVVGPSLTVNGGTLVADEIGGGTALTVNGGSVMPTYAQDARVMNSAGAPLVRVTVDGLDGYAGPFKPIGLDGYGTDGIYPVGGYIFLHLPADRGYLFDVAVQPDMNLLCYADVDHEPVAILAGVTGFTVNTKDIANRAGDGWTFTNGVLALGFSGSDFTLSGSIRDAMSVLVTDNASVTLKNAVIQTSGAPALTIAEGLKVNLSLRGVNTLVSANDVAIDAGAELTIDIPRDEEDLARAEISGTPSAISGGKVSATTNVLLMAGNSYESSKFIKDYEGQPYLSAGRAVWVTVTNAVPSYLEVEVTERAQKVSAVETKDGRSFRVMEGDRIEVGFAVAPWTNMLVVSENPIVIDPIIRDVMIPAKDVRLVPFTVYDEGRHFIRPTAGGEHLNLTSLTNGVVEFVCETDPDFGETVDWAHFATNVNCRVFSVRMYSKEGLVHHLVPLQTEDKFAAGLFDLVTGRSFGNRGGKGAYWCDAVEAKPIAYLKWIDALKRHETLTRAAYDIVTNATAALAAGKWYAVTNAVACGSVAVGGSSHLLLTGDATLTANEITGEGALAVYGQPSGGGALKVSGTVSAALTVEGGVVSAGKLAGAPLAVTGGTLSGNVDGKRSATIDGGSVKVGLTNCVNRSGQPVHRVTAVVGSALRADRGGLTVEGLEGYGTNDICAVEGEVCLWLTNGVYHFVLADGARSYRYLAEVNDADLTVEPLKLGFSVNDVDVIGGSGTGWRYDGEVLTLGSAMTYVLTGSATNDEVQVKVAQEGATVVLSDATVRAGARPALAVEKSVALQMADGASTLAATDGAAVTVAKGATVTVDLAPGASPRKSVIGVDNRGETRAVAGPGTVNVRGGTFFAWADEQAVEEGKLTFEEMEVMRVGKDPETAAYVEKYVAQPYVRVGPAVTVTVKPVPHVTGFTVSNAVETIWNRSAILGGGTAYRVMLGDTVFVGYAPARDYFTHSPNPLTYASVEDGFTVDAGSIEILPYLPYRAWNGETQRMENRTCTYYTVVTNGTAAFEDGQWYAVTGTVSTTDLKVNGAAHLILCDGMALTATGSDKQAGIAVAVGNALSIYGQKNGTGALVANGGMHSAGIGGGEGAGSGAVTIHGGKVTARGGTDGAGIGGGDTGDGGTVTVYGGVVTAAGDSGAAGIGGGKSGHKGTVTVSGGTVLADGYILPLGYTAVEYIESTKGGNQYINTGYVPKTNTRVDCVVNVANNQQSYPAVLFGAQTGTVGGSSNNNNMSFFAWFRSSPAATAYNRGSVETSGPGFVYDQTVRLVCEGVNAKWSSMDGIPLGEVVNTSTVINDGDKDYPLYIFALDEPNGNLPCAPKFYTYLAMKLYSFRIYEGDTLERNFVPCVSDEGKAGLYDTVHGKFYGNCGNNEDFQAGLKLPAGYERVEYIESTSGGKQYIDTDYVPTLDTRIVAKFNTLRISQDDGVFFGVSSKDTGTDGIIMRYNSGSSQSTINGRFCCNNWNDGEFGDFAEKDVSVTLQKDSVTVNGVKKSLSYSGREPYGAPIYIFCSNDGGTPFRHQATRLYSFRIYKGETLECDFVPCISDEGKAGLYDTVHGKFYPNVGEGQFVPGGVVVGSVGTGTGGLGGTVTISGGSVKAVTMENAPSNDVERVYCVTVKCPGMSEERGALSLEGLDEYGTNGIYAVRNEQGESCVYLWLPNGQYSFGLSDGTRTHRYYADVKGQAITVEPLSIGFTVNGVDLFSGPGVGWDFDGRVLSLDSAMTYVLSGAATNDMTQVKVAKSGATVVMSNAVVCTKDRPALVFEQNATLLMAGGESTLAATNESAAVTVAAGAEVAVGLAPGASRKDAMIGVFNFGAAAAVTGVGAVIVEGGTFLVWADDQAVGTPGAFTCGGDVVMMTGKTPETLTYAADCTDDPCVLAGPAVTVTVKDIPQFAGFTVSNAVEAIGGAPVEGGTAYRVMEGDDVFVGYTFAEGFFSHAANPLAYRSVEGDITVDEKSIEILPHLPYRAWNKETRQMEDRVCTDYEVVTAGTTELADGKWYVVTGTVSTTNLKVNGEAHLILCDDATLTANEIAGGALAVYGQAVGSGALEVSGSIAAAMVCEGGVLSAGTIVGDSLAAVGGRVTVLDNISGTVTIDGGTVAAKTIGTGDAVTITGGSVKRSTGAAPKDAMGTPLYCVKAMVGSALRADRGGLTVEGLDGYGTNDIYPIDGYVYLWLPKGEHWFTISDGTKTHCYFADVNNKDIVVEPLSLGFTVNGEDVFNDSGTGWSYDAGVLSLNSAMTYVLSGMSTNGLVQVRVAENGAYVVLSNAVVFTEDRLALDVTRNARLLMAGGESYLVASNAPAMSVSAGAELLVDLAPGGKRTETAVGVFSSGNAVAVAGTGAVTVNGGTLFAWSDRQAVETPSRFACRGNEMMEAGESPETLKSVTACGTQKCVLASPSVSIVVAADIPHVTDVVVSNLTGEVVGTPIAGGKVYRVVMGDDVFVGFKVTDGIYDGPNPLRFPELKSDITVDEQTIPTLGFRVYEDDHHYIQSSGQEWIDTGYVPTKNTRVECVVNVKNPQTEVHTFAAVFGAQQDVRNVHNMTFFGWFDRSARPAYNRAGFETAGTGFFYNTPVKLTCVGRTASWELVEDSTRKGSINILVGNIEDGVQGYPLYIFALHEPNPGSMDPPKGHTYIEMQLYSFKIYDTVGGVEKLVRDFVPCEAEDGSFCGLYDRITKSVYRNKGDGAFTLGVDGSVVPYRAWNERTRQMEDRMCYEYEVVTANTTEFADGKWYVVRDKIERDTITVNGVAHLILCDDATLTANGGEKQAGINVEPGRSLTIYGQDADTGALVARGGRCGAGIGGNNGRSCGMVTIHGGTVTANGGDLSAGIGGGDFGVGGTVTIYGGTVTANGGMDGPGIGGGYRAEGSGAVTIHGGRVAARGGSWGAGIGGGNTAKGGAVTICGGTVTANGGEEAQDIGRGRYTGGGDWTLVIDGGSVRSSRVDRDLAKNSLNDKVYRVTVKCPGLDGLVSLEGLEKYGTKDIFALDGWVYLWLPNGTHRFTLSDGVTTLRYCAIVTGKGISVEPLGAGFFVNGVDIGSGSGPGWAYDEGNVLKLEGNGPFVLSGEATNDLVQVRVTQPDATVVLSNAVVMTEGRPALDVERNVSLKMAGGISYLGAEQGSAAVSVSASATLSVGLAEGADRNEAKIAVFNSGNAAAIAGAGAVRVDDGTFLVWADQHAVENPQSFVCGLYEMLKTGEDFESLKYRNTYADAPCVLVAPGVDVTVPDIPHVAGFTVSNGDETIAGGSAPGGMKYRLMLGDDMCVGYTLEAGFFSRAANPLVYRSVEKDFTVDTSGIQVLPYLPYRAWNETTRQMEDRVCTEYEVVTAGTTELADGQWYAVTGMVERGTIAVNGAAHLILCDDATLTANEIAGGALTICGQAEGLGELIVSGTVSSDLVYEGGMLSARTIAGDSLAVVGGTLTVDAVNSVQTTIDGGTVRAKTVGGTVTITGGSVCAEKVSSRPFNRSAQPLHCVTAMVGSALRADRGGLTLEGLGDYGTNDIYPIDGSVYLWLPAGTHRFTLSDGEKTLRYCAIVTGRDISVEPLGPVGFFVNGEDIGRDGRGPFWSYGADNVLTLFGGLSGNYLLEGEARDDLVQVKITESGATVVLSNTVVMTSGRPAFVVEKNVSLLMKGGESYLVTTNDYAAVTVVEGATLTVDLPPRTNRQTPAVGVFNVGGSVAIGGAGKVAVNGGTLAAWADLQGFAVPSNVTCGAKEVMMTGKSPEALAYAAACTTDSCVLFGPAVTVTVKDGIPHVTGAAVSNAVQAIEGTPVEGGTAYRVMLGEDVFVGYTVEAGCTTRSPNPLAYAEVTDNITVDANAISVLPDIPYRAWNETTGRMEDRVCANYTVVTADTDFEDGKWYAVQDPVACDAITVSGTAHLILPDGTRLTAGEISGGALNIYGQSGGSGELVVSGTVSADLTCEGGALSAGTIAGDLRAVGDGRVTATDEISGTVTIDGGTVAAKKLGDDVTITGGRVTATDEIFGTVTIDGGTVVAKTIGGDVTVTGGSVSAEKASPRPVNRSAQPLYRVTVKVETGNGERGIGNRLNVEGLGEYGTKDIYPIDGKVYLWLPYGTHRFTVSDGEQTLRYCAIVKGRDIEVEPLGSVGFFVNGTDVGKEASGEGWSYLDKVLTLDRAMTYVLTGEATNDEVQVKVTEADATVVLSNAVVMTSMRPAFSADQSASLLMAGGVSYLAATNDASALAVADGATLAVGLAPGADRSEAMVGVFNFGDRTAAIAEPGAVVVGGGTFLVWADRQAVWTPASFTCDAAAEVMMTGAEPDALRYVTACDDAPCVLVAPCATVLVRDVIPHAAITAVSNAVQTLVGTAVEGGTAYRVLPGDDVFVGYTLDAGYFTHAANPLAYRSVEGDITVDADSIGILPYLPYRAWNETTRQMEDRVCTEYTVVTADTTEFADGQWYAVTGAVTRNGKIQVNGAAHLILCDDATLTVNEIAGGVLAVYGQTVGSGALEVLGTVDSVLTCEGGMLSARTIAGDSLAVVGGRVTAANDIAGTVTIAGGTVRTDKIGDAVTIAGGSVKADVIQNAPVNAAGAPLHCVKAMVGSALRADRGGLTLEGLDNYGTNDIYPIDGSVYLWLPDGTYQFTLSDGTTTHRYRAVVNGKDVTVEPRPIGFFVNGVDVTRESGEGWSYQAYVLTLDSKMTYVLTGEATNNEVQVRVAQADATVVLSNAVVFASGRPALDVAENAALLMAGGASYLAATNESAAVTVAADKALAVGLAPNASSRDATVGVFNYGAAKAIAGTGAVVVMGGTFFVWADGQAVETPGAFAFGTGELMVAGETPEAMTYRDACTADPCVLVGPAVTVTVRDGIQHVTGFTVSNAVEAIRGNAVEGGTAYRVMDGDDVYVGYTVEEDCTVYSANPLVYLAVEDDVVVDADAITILPNVHYLAWNAATRQTEECVCTNYTVVTADTATFEDGRWYVVTGAVAAADLTVNGAAHLILCEDARLTADAITGGALAFYGQPGGCGELIVSGAVDASLTCEGGVVSAGTVAGESLAVDGGTLAAQAVSSARTTIDGGSVLVKTGQTDFVNRAGQPVHCVTVKVKGLKAKGLKVEGLEGYGTNDIYPIEDCVYLWLPDGEYWFSLSDGTTTHRYCAIVNGVDLTVEPLGPVGFFVNGEDIGVYTGNLEKDGWMYNKPTGTLMLLGPGPFVFSGVATNNEVSVNVYFNGVTIVLSNAVMVASTRPVINADQDTTILMAGGTSYLASTDESEAIKVNKNGTLTVGLAPGADGSEAMLEVFNSGDDPTIDGMGSVAVNGGTLLVRADEQAVGTAFTCGGNEVMMTGRTSETLRYAAACGTEPFVLVAPGVTVTVKDGIPHVTDITVSNAVQAIEGTAVDGGTAYRVLPGDDVYVSYAVEEGYAAKSTNPLVYADLRGDVTVDANAIQVLPIIPYRAWNGETRQMEDRECADYEVVTSSTEAFADGKWYVVQGETWCGSIAVNGAAHLILCDGATLTATGTDAAGLEVTDGSALTVYGQALGTGALVAKGGDHAAGIGGRISGACGAVTVNGGVVTATGGNFAAGIGGGFNGNGGAVTVNGGRVNVSGGSYAAGIGGGIAAAGGAVTVNGGTVTATHKFTASDIGGGSEGAGATVTINGGSVKAEIVDNDPTNGANAAVWCVTAKVGSALRADRGGLTLEGLGDYGTNDIYAVKNDEGEDCVYLWLPDGTYDFTLSDGETTLPYHVVVDGEDIEVEPLPQTVPVTPGVPVFFDTAAEASNALGRAELTPSVEVAAMFGGDADAKAAYCAKFGFAVVEASGGKWALEAALTPAAWTNLVLSAQAATRQIPVVDIAALSLDTPTNVEAKSCGVPGFYYTVYAGGTVTNLKAVVSDEARNVLCGPGRDVEFSGVVKPSAAAGFFTIGVREAPDVQPSDGHRRLPIIVPPVLPQ